MYKQLSADQLKKHLELPKDYGIDACIIYGSYDERKYKNMFLSLIKDKKYIREKLKDGFLEKILSVKIDGKRIWFIVEYGGTRLSEFIHFASMFGSRKNILVGCCGALKQGLDKFSVIVPESSYSVDSSCHMYLRDNVSNKFYSDKKLSENIIDVIGDKAEVVSGPMMTCQAMMAETWKDVLKWSKEGFYGVEMEASTVFSVSKHFDVPSAAILNVADNLIEKETVDSDTYKSRKSELSRLKRLLLETAINVILQ